MDSVTTTSRDSMKGGGRCQIPLPLPLRLEFIGTGDLKPAKAIVELGIEPSPIRLSQLENLGDALFDSPIRVNQRHEIVDGHARWLIAKKTGRQGLECEVFDYTEEQTIREILKKSLNGPALGKFSRVQIALRLQKFHEDRAKRNRIEGGRRKQLLFLTQVERARVQELVAQDAGVSSSLVRQAKVILRSKPTPELVAALRAETISINRGYQLCSASDSEQRDALATKSLRACNREKSERLIARHVATSERKSATDGLKEIRSGLSRLPDDPLLAPLQQQIKSLLSSIDQLLQIGSEGADRRELA